MGAASVAAAMLAAGVASAQAIGEASAIAEGLFQQARELEKQGRYDEACPKLAESQRLDPKLGTLLNLAVCHEKQGKLASAWAEYTSAAGIALRDGQKDREAFARKQVAALEKKLARVVLQVTTPEAGLQITLDQQPMSAAVLGAPLPIDPGKHRVAATAPGKTPWSLELDVPAQPGEIVVSIPALQAAPPPAPPPVAPPVAAPPPVAPVAPPPKPVPEPSNTPAVLMGVGFGVGAAGVLVGAIAGGITLSNASAIKAVCSPTSCPSGQQGALDSANTTANVANVAFALGAAGLVVGIVGVALRPKARDTGVLVTPLVSPGMTGVRVAF